MNATICAQVNPRLLSKAGRLFTGSLRGRIIEILQNARRAGATTVTVTNEKGLVTVQDNGSGIDSFANLLDLGGSGWPEQSNLEQSEDPAGVGIFCLAPRKLTVRSNGQLAVIEGEGWSGAPVQVQDDPNPVQGTWLRFEDESWSKNEVEPLAAFTSMAVIVDGQSCHDLPFIAGKAVDVPELGCRVKVIESSEAGEMYTRAVQHRSYDDNVFVNFHGQVVAFHYRAIEEHRPTYLVDMTGEPTNIRLMLPARTRVIENEALEQLKQILERQTYLYLKNQGSHRLYYEHYQRARELGIDLPESEPVYRVGLLGTDEYGVDPVEVIKPEDFDLARCYRFDYDSDDPEQTGEANTHLLAGLGKFNEPFLPVEISKRYDGYSWAELPKITRIEVRPGKVLHESWIWSGKVTCVDALSVTAHAGNGKVFGSDVCMAVQPEAQDEDKKPFYCENTLYVTKAARQLNDTELWHHLGGFCDEGDTWDTQQRDFSEQMARFWAQMMGPDEPLRQKIMDAVYELKDEWRSVTILSSGAVTIHYKDGTDKTIVPPQPEGSAS